MLEESKDPYVMENWYDWLKYNGGYDYSKKGHLTNHTFSEGEIK